MTRHDATRARIEDYGDLVQSMRLHYSETESMPDTVVLTENQSGSIFDADNLVETEASDELDDVMARVHVTDVEIVDDPSGEKLAQVIGDTDD